MRPLRLKSTWTGMAASVLFVLIFSLEGWLRPDYVVSRTQVSALSLGPRGWVQILNFLVSGGLLFRFANALLDQDHKPKLGPYLLALTALCLMLSGPLVMDPPGTPRSLWSWHGWLHQLLGGIAFSLFPTSCFVFYRAHYGNRSFQRWSLVAGGLLVLAIICLKLGQTQSTDFFFGSRLGLFQRLALVVYMSWVFWLAYSTSRLGKTR